MGQFFEIKDDGTIVRQATSKKPKTWIILMLIFFGIIGIVVIRQYTKVEEIGNGQVTNAPLSNPVNPVPKTITSPKNVAFPDKDKIITLINRYNNGVKNNQFSTISSLYANRVKRFYNIYNTDNGTVIENLKKYDTMFGVNDKHFDVHWNTLKFNKINDNTINVNYTVDYTLDRIDKSKPSKYVLNMIIELNSDYQIVSIYEDIKSKN